MLRDRIALAFRGESLPWIIILAGVVFTLLLQSLVPGEVFYSGDAGLKTLMAKQFASGRFYADLRLGTDAWMRDLWDHGLYPFEPPFVYQRFFARYVAFPLYYPLLNAPAYALLGFRGLYLIPLVSTWLLWLRFRRVCSHLRIASPLSALALATLMFASPLTLYSATYWEHSLAILLAFWGMTVVVPAPSLPVAPRKALLGGLLVGSSVWLRPEMICLAAILGTLVSVSPELNLSRKGRLSFVCGSLCAVLALGVANVAFYGHPLGVHALQVIENFSILGRLGDSLKILIDLALKVSYHLPITLFPIPFLLAVLLNRRTVLPQDMKLISLVAFSLLLMVPLILPNSGGKQWGPRFLLFLTPLLVLLAILRLRLILKRGPKASRRLGLTIFLTLFALGFYLNTFLGVWNLKLDYETRVLPALEALLGSEDTIVAVSHQYIAQELEAAIGQKTFFLTRHVEDLHTLARALHRKGYSEFVLLCHPPAGVPDCIPPTLVDKEFSIELTALGRHGSYLFYEASLVSIPRD